MVLPKSLITTLQPFSVGIWHKEGVVMPRWAAIALGVYAVLGAIWFAIEILAHL